ncbi:hypothetical protein HAX54_044921 [Datura stramonium]|uniref:Uncharacterized protein n=1 Tax=Datura stramonium TaxID=4076 RepID=A0ABS8SQ37_DATST|nr:hypothetical protein [Datura stramonium]
MAIESDLRLFFVKTSLYDLRTTTNELEIPRECAAVTSTGEYDMVMIFLFFVASPMYYMAYDKAKVMLQTNRQVLEKIVEELLKYEVLTRKDLERIIADNDGMREKEPFFLSKAYNEPVLENFLQENGKASSMEFLTAAN